MVADVRHQDATKDGLVEVFFPYRQRPVATAKLAVRADGRICRNVSQLAPSIVKTIAALDPAVQPARVQEVRQMASDRLGPKRLTAALTVAFAGPALLAVIGIYGVLSFTVAQRTHEIGIRVALGASRGAVVRAVVGEAAGLAGIGAAIGAALALAFGRVLRSLLFGISAADPLVFAGAVLALVGIVALASYLPARHAARIDPIAALRRE